MAPRKTERIVNLTIALLVAGRYLPKTRIRELVEGYHGLTDAAFERTFERDKDELRELGVPIEVGGYDPLFEDEAGYRILPSEFSLPPIELDAEEASVVGVAARVWQHASMASSTQSAMTKLRAAGVEPDPSALAALEPSVQATEPAFGPLWNAVRARGGGRSTSGVGSRRTRARGGLPAGRGRWSVVGRDLDREATRMFKLSRIGDVPVAVSRPGAFEAPEGLDLRTLAAKLDPQEPTAEALLAVRTGKSPSLTRRGRPAESAPDLAWAADGREGWWVGYGSLPGMAEEVAGHGADVLVVEPAELREAVVGRLRKVAARAGAVAR